ncbi:hypothetical protein M404DRAFT_155843 [Pisolithus tinctorius Marx 270]|uniref:Protein kinase domain-containing protein n=1 Tax=Pisolithus tinctorius Marx 270 TaxID=870435 RepID=A0A0C3JNW6_PISTI|nr:hypothetical protein M404DRAFT_155843 [Pisolithus tinctorius Marx 270]
MRLPNHDGRLQDNPDFEHHLQQLSERASRFAIDLNDQVDRDTKEYFIGGDAIVYKGRLRPEGTFVAVKTFRFAHRGDSTVLKVSCILSRLPDYYADQLVKTILREVHVWSKLMHPNVLPLLGITTKFDSTISIISKWMSNGNAHDYVQDPKVDPRPLVRRVLDIANGLQYLHNHHPPIYHGDLKGSNVLVSDDGRAMLTDFGLPFLISLVFTMDTNATNQSSMNWTAPEGFDQPSLTAEMDVWAFGMTALELFTRQPPFHDIKKCSRVMSQIAEGRMPSRPSSDSTCFRMTDSWWKICRSCWEHDPSLRPNMLDIASQVKQIPVCRNGDGGRDTD